MVGPSYPRPATCAVEAPDHPAPPMRPPSSPPIRLAGALGLVVLLAACGSSDSVYPQRLTLPSLEEPYLLPTERCGDYFIVSARIDGAGPFRLLLDSGAGQTLLDPSVVAEAGLDGGIATLEVGNFTALDFAYDELEMAELSAALRSPVRGILGHPVFNGILATWDFPAGAIRLRAGALPEEGEGIVRARDSRRPWVGAVVQSDTLWILLDTGSSRGLTLRDPERFAYRSPLQVTGARVRVDGVHMVESGRLEGTARVGPIRVEEPVVSNSVSVDLVGQEVLRHLRITFDQANDRVRFERPGGPLEQPMASPPVRWPGFALEPDATGGDVIHVAPAAEAAGLRVGDRIVAVDGTPWTARGCRDPDAPVRADPTTLDVVRGGDRLSLSVPARVVHPRDP